MKKIFVSFASLLLAGNLAFSQGVADQAVIPVSVTLNSILRLNVTSGGNIEFVVNTLDDYTNGIPNIARYTTTFTVASSIDFDVLLYAEDATLMGVSGGTMILSNLGYVIESTGTGTPGIAATDTWALCALGANPTAVQALTDATTIPEIVSSQTNHGAGPTSQNTFEIQWELGTMNAPMELTSLLSQSIPADRYSTNVFLVVEKAD